MYIYILYFETVSAIVSRQTEILHLAELTITGLQAAFS